MANEIDLSAFDEPIKSELDLSAFDEPVKKKESTTPTGGEVSQAGSEPAGVSAQTTFSESSAPKDNSVSAAPIAEESTLVNALAKANLAAKNQPQDFVHPEQYTKMEESIKKIGRAHV